MGNHICESGKWGIPGQNVYYNPERCGLELVSVFDKPDMCYEFDITIVVRDTRTGQYYTVSDSGCSCPTPFEDVHSFADMTRISKHEALHFENPYK